MAFAADTEQGATFALTGLSMDIAASEIPSIKRSIQTVPVPHLGTTGQVPYISGDLIDTDPFTVTFLNDGSSVLPTLGTVYTCTITGPIAAGDGAGEIQAGSVIFVDDGSSKYTANSNTAQTRALTFKPNGGANSTTAWTRTAAA